MNLRMTHSPNLGYPTVHPLTSGQPVLSPLGWGTEYRNK